MIESPSGMPDILQFYASSASAPPPGKGTGESVADPSKYAELKRHDGWRRILASSAETPFVWKGLTWKTAEHAYRVWHLETKNPEAFLSSSQGEMPKAAPVPNTTVLKEILHEKFTQNTTAKEILLLTGDAELWHTVPRAHWTWLEEIREDLKRNLRSTEEMSSAASPSASLATALSAKKKQKKTPVQRVSAQGGAELPFFKDATSNFESTSNEEEQEQEPQGDTVTHVPINVRATGVEDSADVDVDPTKTKKSAIRFCSVCDNYLYLQVEGETQTLQRMCRNCGFKDTEDQGGLVSEMHIEQRAAEGYTLINEFTLKDKRLPHLYNTMKCINATCPSAAPGKESDIVYIKYDTENLRYIYMCYICQATWRSRR
jgi:hypothetical protein